jgi:hypothetical protein
MRSVFNLKRRTRETCKTRHTLILTGHNNKISRGEGKLGSLGTLDNLSEYQIDALSNLLRVEVTNNDCFYISRSTGSEKSAVLLYISLYFLSLYMKRFSYLYRMITGNCNIGYCLLWNGKKVLLEKIIQLLYANYMSIFLLI